MPPGGPGRIETFGEDLAARLGTNLRTLHQSLAAVAEFKGETYGHGSIAGVVRFVQVDEETCVVGRVSGLEPGRAYAVTVRAFGDVTAASRAWAVCGKTAASWAF